VQGCSNATAATLRHVVPLQKSGTEAYTYLSPVPQHQVHVVHCCAIPNAYTPNRLHANHLLPAGPHPSGPGLPQLPAQTPPQPIVRRPWGKWRWPWCTMATARSSDTAHHMNNMCTGAQEEPGARLTPHHQGGCAARMQLNITTAVNRLGSCCSPPAHHHQ
jgi:hypothetical protein